MVPGCVCLRACSPPHRICRRRAAGHRAARSDPVFRRRILEPDSVHDADGHHHRGRLRGGDIAARAPADSPARGDSPHAEGSGCLRGFFRDDNGACQLGVGPDLQRNSGARNREEGAPRGLSRDRRGGLPGHLQRVGAGAFFLGGAGDGDAVVDSAGAARDQRNDSAEPDDLHLAKHGACGHSDRVRQRGLSLAPRHSTRTAESFGVTEDLAAEKIEAPHAGRMAGIRAGAFDLVGGLGWPTSRRSSPPAARWLLSI